MTPKEILRTWPSTIHLICGDELENFNECQEVTWCADPAMDGNVEYVRADLAPLDRASIDREALELAWVCGYYHAGYTHDSAYANAEANKYADEVLLAQAEQPASRAAFHDDIAYFTCWKGYPLPDMNADDQFPNDALHREFVAYRAGLRRGEQPAPVVVCGTCNDHGIIGGPSYQQPDEGGAPCPDCRPAPADEEKYASGDRAAYLAEKKDAERYRILRDLEWVDDAIMWSNGIVAHLPDTLDAAIDAAIAAKEKS